ncbi:MAG: hypothetical protein EHM37_21340 [Deltaproteobacteria bacterium]|nr:MAG: hypothetical protein EHM37_21340 [Deltaproteobacteria bacterium]
MEAPMSKTMLSVLLAVLLAGTPGLALEITSVAPTRATPATRVILTGGIFSPQTRIFLGEQLVAPTQVLPRELVFIVPPLPPGSYSLTVQDEIDTVVEPFNFEVLAAHPQIVAVEPSILDVCADETKRLVRVEGENFRPGTMLLLNSNAVNSRVLDAGSIEFRFPDLPAGVYGVEARNPDGTTSLPHSLWVNSVPEITGIERGEDFVNHYEVFIRGNNFFFNSILVVSEPDTFRGSGYRQITYYGNRSAPNLAQGTYSAQGESLQYNDCRTLLYMRYPNNFQDKELILQVFNPDGKKTEPYSVTLP